MNLFHAKILTLLCQKCGLTAKEYEFDSDDHKENVDENYADTYYRFHVHFLVIFLNEKYCLIQYWSRYNHSSSDNSD